MSALQTMSFCPESILTLCLSLSSHGLLVSFNLEQLLQFFAFCFFLTLRSFKTINQILEEKVFQFMITTISFEICHKRKAIFPQFSKEANTCHCNLTITDDVHLRQDALHQVFLGLWDFLLSLQPRQMGTDWKDSNILIRISYSLEK